MDPQVKLNALLEIVGIKQSDRLLIFWRATFRNHLTGQRLAL